MSFQILPQILCDHECLTSLNPGLGSWGILWSLSVYPAAYPVTWAAPICLAILISLDTPHGKLYWGLHLAFAYNKPFPKQPFLSFTNT